MRTIATTLAAMLAVALAASAFAQTPKALGWERGQAVPQSAIAEQGSSEGPQKSATVWKPVAGLDKVVLEYTEKLGVCAVYGYGGFTSIDPSLEVRQWAERVATKFGGVAGTKVVDDAGSKAVVYVWNDDDLPGGYSLVMVTGPFELDGETVVMMGFFFDNHDACEAEQEAWTQAEL